MRVQINGEVKELTMPLTLSDLIEQLALPRDRVAVELNRAVVRRGDWPLVTLNEGDHLEIVHFVGGG